MVRARPLAIAAVVVSVLACSFGGSSGGPAHDAPTGMRATGRADPQINRIDVHSAAATWDFSDNSSYNINHAVVSPGKANLSQGWNLSGEMWMQLAGLGGGNEREDFSAAYDETDNMMIIHGGYYWTSGMQNANYFQNLYTYDPAANSWTSRGAAKLPHGNVGVWDDADHCFITHGGAYFDYLGDTYYAQTWAWYPGNTSWTRLADGPTRFFHSAAWDPVDGVMLVFGGQDISQGSPYGDLWAYQYSANTWTKLNPSGGGPGARIDHAAVWDNESKQMIVFGGFDSQNALSDTWAYNYSQNSWTQKTAAAAGRMSHAACWNSDLAVMTVFGGSSGGSNSNDTLLYDPTADSWSVALAMPTSGRIESSAVYDPVRRQMIVYGGGTGSGADEFSETWSLKYGAPALKYAQTGTIQSPVLDMGDDFHKIGNISWYGELPPGTGVTIRTRASPANINISGFQATANGSAPAQQGRYFQWNISLASSADRLASPAVAMVKLEYTVNSKPQLTVGPPLQAPKNKAVRLGCNVTDADGDLLTYDWRVSGPRADLNASDVPSPSFTPNRSGTYIFAVVVSDGYASSPPAAVTVIVANRLPVANAGPDAEGYKNELVTLHGAGTDADGDTLTYDWSQTGGPDANLTQTSKSFLSFLPQKAGNYTFQLVVNDGEVDSEASSVMVTVEARPPEAVLAANASLTYLRNEIEFSAEKSSDIDGKVMKYFFDFGDQTDSGWTNVSVIAHAYTRPGVFNATLKVRDEDGLISPLSAPVRLTVRNRPPVVKGTVTPMEGNTSTLFRFSVPSGSTYDPDGEIVSYIWDFGDGATAATSATSHTFKNKGSYEISFKVTDEFGAETQAHFTVNVLNRAPVILTSAPATACFIILGNEQLFTVTAQDPDGDILDYQWTIDGQRQSSNDTSVIYKPLKRGLHLLNVTVSDGGLSVCCEWNVSVLARPAAGTEKEGPDMMIAVGAVIIIAACAAAVYAAHRRDRKNAPAYQPGQPATPAAGEVPMALPVNEALPPRCSEGPMEALPVQEDGPPLGPRDPIPNDPWKPVQEPYSKQLWNK